MSSLRLAVIGAGHLGRIHAKLAKQHADVEIVAVTDPFESARQRIEDELDLPTQEDYRSLIGKIDAAIVAAPTVCHLEICRELLANDIHVLVEKPITLETHQATELVELADKQSKVLQVGHVERFNPAMQKLAPELGDVYYLEATRATGFTFRSTDVGVVMDLMIHDIDLALSLIKSEVREVKAVGVSVFGEHEDIAQARIEFANGSVANLTASRASYAPQRSMQLFTQSGFASVDMAAGKAVRVQPHPELANRTLQVRELSPEQQTSFREELFEKWLPLEEVQVDPINAILEEQQDFIHAIHNGTQPKVTGADGRDAVAVAEEVLRQLKQHRWGTGSMAPQGPLATPGLPVQLVDFNSHPMQNDKQRHESQLQNKQRQAS